jgi:hypothetical protein
MQANMVLTKEQIELFYTWKHEREKYGTPDDYLSAGDQDIVWGIIDALLKVANVII